MIRGAAYAKALGPSFNGAVPWSKNLITRNGQILIPCIIKSFDPEATVMAVEEAKGSASIAGDELVSAYIPFAEVQKISSRNEVVFTEAAPRLTSKMNSARSYSGVADVQAGAVDGVKYDGRNVVVGAVDDGLDYGNLNFTNSSGVTRIQYVWERYSTDDVRDCYKSEIAAGNCSIDDNGQGTVHGTHVTGIAASSDATYTGVATAADIMFVFSNADDPDPSGSASTSFGTSVLDGVSLIFGKADEIDKAAVVNISMGTSLGAHDGTSLLESGISALTAAKPGRIVVNAAGNEQVIAEDFEEPTRDYVGGIHASVDVAAGVSKAYRFAIWNGFSAALTGGTIADVWLTSGQKDACSVAIFGYTNGRSTPDFTFPELRSTSVAELASADVPFATSTTDPVTATGNDVTASIEIDQADARNSKPRGMITVNYSGQGTANSLEDLWFDVVIRAGSGGACSGNIWLYPDYTTVNDFLKNIATGEFDVATSSSGAGYVLADGDSFYTTTIPATATGVIAAGSFMPPRPAGAATSTWTGDDDVTYDQSDINAPGGSGSVTGGLSSFTSLGPTADGRTKPDVVAPGEPIVSTKSRGVSESDSVIVDTNYLKLAGTSMSSPHVAGIVALLLQRNNTLGVDAVRTALVTGATTDGMVSPTPDPANSYGAGKVNAVSVLSSVAADTSAYSGTGDSTRPSSGGCSLIVR